MHLTRSQVAARRLLALAALACGTMTTGRAEGGAMSHVIDYSTTGTIDTNGTTGSPVVSFQGINDGVVQTPPSAFRPAHYSFPIPQGYGSILPLGQFDIAPESGNTPTTYDNAKFDIALTIRSIDGQPSPTGPITVNLQGVLNGSVPVLGQSSTLSAVFGQVSAGLPYDTEHDIYGSRFFGPNSILGLVSPTTQIPVLFGQVGSGIQSPLSAVIIATNTDIVPEPSVLAMLVLSGALLVGRRYLARARGTRADSKAHHLDSPVFTDSMTA